MTDRSNQSFPLQRIFGIFCVASLWSAIALESYAHADDQHKIEFFETRIRPVLSEHCYSCHNSHGQSDSGLILDWRGGIIAGGDNGIIVMPGDPSTSKLIAVLKHEIQGLEMPQGGVKLSDSIVADFEKWIRDGIADPRNSPPSKQQYEVETSWSATFKRRLNWWSLQAIAPKTTHHSELSKELHLPPGNSEKTYHDEQPLGSLAQEIDQHIAMRLNEVGLSRQSPASPTKLVRRLYHQLLGLPPTRSEMEHAIQLIEQRDSIEPVVDKLLSRPEFGEKWARHWMDWTRYADSHGSEGDPSIDNAWLYRDYLIRALNQDVPYDQLIREHIAGDLLRDPRIDAELGFNESIIAMAHWRMVFHGFFPTDALDEKVRFLDDQVNVFSKAFLGLTVSCARCHDHKFDPISQEDYYSLFALFNDSRPARVVIDTPEHQSLHLERLQSLKQSIRIEMCDQWLADKERLIRGLAADTTIKSTNAAFPRVLPVWSSIKDSLAQKQTPDAIRQSINAHRTDEPAIVKRWAFHPDHPSDWIADGIGLKTVGNRIPEASAAGEFRLASEGNAIITELLPSGVYGGLISSKHAARLTSSDIPIESGLQAWGLVRGDGEAVLRAVVQDYPRMGGIYPFVKPSSEWRWEKMDMSYWDGDSMHIELANALDTAMPISDRARSWFGVKEIVLSKSHTPPDSKLPVLHVLETVLNDLPSVLSGEEPPPLEKLANRFAEEILKAVEAWRDGTISDEQAVMLEELLQADLLANRLDQFDKTRGTRIEMLLTEYRNLEKEIKVPTRIPSIEDTRGRTQQLYIRGDHKNPGPRVIPRFLSALSNHQAVGTEDKLTSEYDRLRLADEVLRHDNPLVHRVIINRIWHHLFGRGLVLTPDNFGKLGEPPTHPELLDHLASLFRQKGTSLKSMIKLMVMSETWQTDSKPSTDALRLDPDNRLWSHAMVRRLDAEGIRDSMLKVSGELDPAQFGPTVSGDSNRRGVYVRVQRNNLDPFLRAFDFPEPFATVGRRDSTNVPAQSLALMNDPQIAKLVDNWAKKMMAGETANLSPREKMQSMFANALGRLPTNQELDVFDGYYRESIDAAKAIRESATKRKTDISSAEVRLTQLKGIASERYSRQHSQSPPPMDTVQPLVQLTFKRGLNESIKEMPIEYHNGAKISDGALLLDGRGYAVSAPLAGVIGARTISTKTLEAWVQLDGFQQRGGGVFGIQSIDGSRFDSIVFGEQTPGRWMAGSNFFNRTQPFNGPEEKEAVDRIVHVAIAYQEDGTIVGYRDGKPYGTPYRSPGVELFQASDAVLSLGVRHLPAANGKMLVGKIFDVRLYDRALSAKEIEASFQSYQYGFQLSDVPTYLESNELEEWNLLSSQAKQWKREMDKLSPHLEVDPERQALSDIGRTIFMMKEFLFLR